MKIIHSANFVENGQLNYIVAISLTCTGSPCTLDGTEIIVHNNTVYPATGGIGIPAVVDTHFYAMYKK